MRFLVSLCFVLAAATPAFAAFEGPGADTCRTAAQALQLPDDTPCVLEGHIVEKLASDKDEYRFRDASGAITVDIDAKDFGGRAVTPETRVRLYGEVDKSWTGKRQVDVDRLEVLP